MIISFSEVKCPPMLNSKFKSVRYRSIELLMGENNYGPQLDMWSAGCKILRAFRCRSVVSAVDIRYESMTFKCEETDTLSSKHPFSTKFLPAKVK